MKGPTRNQTSSPWMAAHAHLKNEFTEDEKYHNLMSWSFEFSIYQAIWKGTGLTFDFFFVSILFLLLIFFERNTFKLGKFYNFLNLF